MISRRGLLGLLAGAILGRKRLFAAASAEAPTKPIPVPGLRPPLPPLEPIRPMWTGNTLADLPSVPELIRMVRISPVIPERRDSLLSFYAGEQWDANLRRLREEGARPSLVSNMLPTLVSGAVSRHRHEGFGPLSDQELDDVVFAITMLNADAQRLYNWEASCAAEVQALCVRRYTVRAK